MLREGSPLTSLANTARAPRASATIAVGTPGTSLSATTRTAPRRMASEANSAPSRLKPGIATKAKPGSTQRESCVTPPTPRTPEGISVPRTQVSFARAGHAGSTPRMLGFQAEGASPLVAGHDFESPETVASAIRIGSPASKEGALSAARKSGGLIESVTDGEILAAQEMLAQEEGVFCEPASAAGIAGLIKLAGEGRGPEGTVVSVLTGHGLKDPDVILGRVQLPDPVPATFEAVAGRMERPER